MWIDASDFGRKADIMHNANEFDSNSESVMVREVLGEKRSLTCIYMISWMSSHRLQRFWASRGRRTYATIIAVLEKQRT
jgi:hypothetical protein